MRWSALRVSGGNQVDGLPPARHTEPRWIGVTLAPRFVIMIDIFMFLVTFYIMSYWFVTFRCFTLYWSLIFCEYQLPSSTKPLLKTGVFAHRKSRKNDEIFEFSWKSGDKNSWILKFIFEELLMKEISRINYKLSDLLYEFPAETRLTVYRRLDIRK